MKLLLVADGHYYCTEDGKVYAQSVFDAGFYQRYTDVFEQVYAVIRAVKVTEAPQNAVLSSTDRVTFLMLPEFKGPFQYIQNFFHLKALYKKYSLMSDCAIFRIPGAISMSLLAVYRKLGRKYAIEMVADPNEILAPGNYKSLVRPFMRAVWVSHAKKFCREAVGSAYVTKQYLQSRYPSRYRLTDGREGVEANYSSVSITREDLGAPRTFAGKTQFVMSHIANTFSGYGKGHVTLIEAVKKLTDRGLDVKAVFVGDGPYRQEFESLAASLGIPDRIHFTGRISSKAKLLQTLASSDVFVLPTKTEGLPRSLIEAMAVGLPCISSPVGGVPELLDDEWMVNYNDSDALAGKIAAMVSDTQRMEALSKANLQVAETYCEDHLQRKRVEFYTEVKRLCGRSN